jgi:hypothetical protein
MGVPGVPVCPRKSSRVRVSRARASAPTDASHSTGIGTPVPPGSEGCLAVGAFGRYGRCVWVGGEGCVSCAQLTARDGSVGWSGTVGLEGWGVAMVLLRLNRVLRAFGVLLVPCPPSAKMMHEHANVSESHHPSRGGRTVAWMRLVGSYMEGKRRR